MVTARMFGLTANKYGVFWGDDGNIPALYRHDSQSEYTKKH